MWEPTKWVHKENVLKSCEFRAVYDVFGRDMGGLTKLPTKFRGTNFPMPLRGDK